MRLNKSEIREKLIEQLKTEGGIQDAIDEAESLLVWGINSITVMKILSQWTKNGYKVPFSELIRDPYIDKWAEIFSNSYKGNVLKERNVQKENMYEPFDLTDIQYAYWIGRDRNQKLGGVGCHGYFEVDCVNLALNRLEDAWEILFEYHPMLRAGFTPDGKQKVLKEAFHKQIQFIDMDRISIEEREKKLLQIRHERSHRLLDIENGEVISLVVTKWDNRKYRMHFEIDLLVCDVQSFGIILNDLAAYYLRKEKPKAEKEWNFAQYLKERKKKKESDAEAAEEYWKEHFADLPDGPKLPMKSKKNTIEQQKFYRHSIDISEEEMNVLAKKGSDRGATLALVLLTAYGMTISKWADNKRFLMNVPIFNREEESIKDVVADFTNLLLVEMDYSERKNFAEYLSQVQKSFFDSMDHSAYSGVEILRELRKIKDEDVDASIVFSCNLGRPIVSKDFKDAFNDIGYMISQTPQVLIDFQAFTAVEGLNFMWDAADEMFPDGMVEEIFQCFVSLIHKLADDGSDWDQVTEVISQSQKCRKKNAEKFTFEINTERNMLSNIFSNGERYPHHIALIQPGKESITYGELIKRAKCVAANLQSKRIEKGDYVAVLMPRGINCLVSEIAIMAAGAVYVPISIEQPELRRNAIISAANCKAILTLEEIEAEEDVIVVNYEEALKSDKVYEPVVLRFQDSAYLIFTSGSTGTPKGVEIAHGAAMNTIDDVNSRYRISMEDTAISVSSNDFDLSVYDIFGILNVGGKLVVITNKEKRDALTWLSYVREYDVTVWNSVPTLMKMLLIEAENEESKIASLKLVILSGDWISFDIPDRIKMNAPNAQLVSMGGATEASIWSNFFDVKETIPEDWESIPYGEPLKNQFYRVMGDDGLDCPDEVIGELWIGGAGVAKGYIGDTKLTEEKFVKDLGKRWYRTGDNGKIWRNGIIEFVGRRDNQIKLRGHRIELGEIESGLSGCENIQQAVAVIYEKNGNKQLCAFVTGDDIADSADIGSFSKKILESISFDSYDMQKELDMESVIEEVTIEMASKLVEALPDIEKLSVEKKYKELYKKWKQMSQINPKSKLKGYEAEKDLLRRFANPFILGAPDILLKASNPNELLLTEEFVAPSKLAGNMPRGAFLMKGIVQIIREGQEVENKGFRILEIGARDIDTSAEFISVLEKGSYTFVDKSLFFINTAKKRFNNDGKVSYIVSDLNEGTYDIQLSYDLIIVNYTLHQFSNIGNVLTGLEKKQKPGGLILITEMIKEMPMQSLTSVFLLPEEYTDFRKDTKQPLLNNKQWLDVFAYYGLNVIDLFKEKSELLDSLSQTMYVVLKKNKGKKIFDERAIKDELSNKVPEYMVPEKIKCLTEFPLTANGKVDRKKLLNNNELWVSSEKKEIIELPKTETEKTLCKLWKEVLGRSIGRRENYFGLGGDSLLATILTGKVKKEFNIPFALENIFKYPILCDMAAKIDELSIEDSISRETEYTLVEDREHKYEPFPLTDIQQAYWIGRGDAFNYSDVTTHCYFEMDCYDFNLERAEKVWNELVAVHGMLRAVILIDGEHQKILEKTDYYKLQIYDASDNQGILEDLRAEMSQEQIDIYSWPLFDIRAVKFEGKRSRLFISFDNIVLDGFSMFYLFREWADLVEHKEKSPIPEQVSFRDYILSYKMLKYSEKYNEDIKYWEKKLPDINSAPEFSTFIRDTNNAKRFKRFSYRLKEDKWLNITERLRNMSLTPAVFLMGTYAEVLARWSVTSAFSINLTRFNRIKFSDNIDSTVGDYTSLTIHSINLSNGNTIEERLRNIQEHLWSDLNHPLVSGIEVERMLNKAYGTGSMPVVFTCGLGLESGNTERKKKYPGKIIYGNSQTPQVWLDYQVYEDQGELEISWDALVDIFPEGMVEEMFNAYIVLLGSLADNADKWSKIIPNLIEVGDDEQRILVNKTDKKFPNETLTSLFLNSSYRFKNNIALIDECRTLTYEQLLHDASSIAKTLVAEGIKKQDIVAVFMEKGWEQVVTVLAILLSGGIYLPLNNKAPKQRNKRILAISGTVRVIDQENFERLLSYSEDVLLPEVSVLPEDLAYIIYTSGTTGDPKGVAIEHRGAVNTILDINDRIQIKEDDRAIAISDLSFDLSVYDIFGMLASGGAVVFTKQGLITEPSEWKRVVEEHRISVWNTVPMFMQMFTQYLQVHPFEKQVNIKHILMSGDWIPLSIYDDIRTTIGNVSIYGLGGASEASIWSNIYEIKEINNSWRSIPYGKPLSNQRYYILDKQLMDCPYDVIGDLYIEGSGLAREYWHNDWETKNAFIIHPEKKCRLYKTGDRALFMRDGNIEFCGRNDGQVKIAGFRIELEEIDNNVRMDTNVMQSVSIVKEGDIFTFIVRNDSVDDKESEEHIKSFLNEKLPHYMIPMSIIQVDRIPFTQNGKVDRKKLIKMTEKKEIVSEKDPDRNDWTEVEKEIAVLWKEILKIDRFTKNDNFVQVGGNSLAAVQLVNKIVQKYRIEFMISDFYENLTIARLAQFIETATEEEVTGEL